MWDSLENMATNGAWILIGSAIQATALLAAVGLIAWSMRHASAAVRHMLWFGAVIGLAVLPLLTVILPGWEVLPRWEVASTAPDVATATATVEPEESYPDFAQPDALYPGSVLRDTPDGRAVPPVLRPPEVSDEAAIDPAAYEPAPKPERSSPAFARPDASYPTSAPPEILGGRTVPPVVRPPEASDEAAIEPAPTKPALAIAWLSWRSLILVVWMIGVMAALVPVVAGTVSLAWLERTSTRIGRGPLDSAAQRAVRRLGVKRRVRLLLNERRSMPMMWGVLRPKVLIPTVAQTWSAERIETVLMHELAHVRRLDCLTQFMSRAVCSLYWFHPQAWWAARRMRAEGESACDDLVLLTGCRPADYAEHLLEIAAGSRAALPLGSAAIGLAWRSHLEIRLRAILDDGRNRLGATYTSTAGCLVLVAGLSGPLALLRSEPAESGLSPEIAAAENPFVHQVTSVSAEGMALPIRLGYVDDTAEGAKSIAGGGHAVKFQRPERARLLMAVEIFAHRYGYPSPPAEDFCVYILDKDRKLIEACSYPYGQIDWGFPRWHTLKLPAVEVPDEYYVALVFNPHQTKGVFLAFDRIVKQSHSFFVHPETGYEPISEGFDWMVRSVLVHEIPKVNPFDMNDES